MQVREFDGRGDLCIYLSFRRKALYKMIGECSNLKVNIDKFDLSL